METTQESKTLQTFVSHIGQSKVAVIVPLYGYHKDSEVEQLSSQSLQVALARLKSSKHHLYFIFVAEPERLVPGLQDIILGKTMGGNTMGVSVTPFSSYAEYVSAGVDRALTETDAQFVMVYNPWIMIKETGVDDLIDRANKGDIGIVSGFEVNRSVNPADFDSFAFNLPKEHRDLNMNFLAMSRPIAEMIEWDENYKTHFYVSLDIAQRIHNKGFEVITSQFIPIFSFDVDWKLIENPEDYEADKTYFIKNWKFDPGIEY